MLAGKLIEFLGAIFLAAPVLKAAFYELRYRRLLERTPADRELEEMDRDFGDSVERWKLHFGRFDGWIVLVGTVLFVLGNGVYLYNLAKH